MLLQCRILFHWALKNRALLVKDVWCNKSCKFSYEQDNAGSISDYMTLRQLYLDKEKEWESSVDSSYFTDDEKNIYELHKEACKNFKFTYIDPHTGYQVFTRYRHFLRNKCCGTGCRHCPFGHEAVHPERKENMRFNSAFFVSLNDSQ